MVLGGIVAAIFGVAAEGRSLEEIATPLNAALPARTGTTRVMGAGSPTSPNE
jgi:hypothetical protein